MPRECADGPCRRLIALVAAAMIGHPAPAQSGSADAGDPVQSQLEKMRQEIEGLRKENQSMKGEIDELKAVTNEEWLTEARANEIRGLVQDVLADADTRASLLNNGMTAGWSEHFFLASPDGRFKLVLEGQMQIRWVYNYKERPEIGGDADQHRHGFENTRTRLTFRGHVFDPDLEYLIRSDFARTTPTQAAASLAGADLLLDAWVRYNFTDHWSLRFGQFKLPFNREELVSSAYQLAVERSLVNEATNIGRSQGIELAYADDLNRMAFVFSDGASPSGALAGQAFLGGPRTNTSALAVDTEYAVTARYERLTAGSWDQFDDFTSPRDEQYGALVGFAVHAQDGESTGVSGFFGQATTRVVSATADLSIEWGGANAFIAGTYHYVDTPAPQGPFAGNFGILHVIGVVAQAGIYVTPKWELFVRGEYAQIDGQSGSSVNVPDLNLVTLGANYYLEGHDLKWTTDIGVGISDVSGAFASDLAGYRTNEDETAPQVVFRSQFQLLF